MQSRTRARPLVKFPDPTIFEPVDCSEIETPAELEAMIAYAFNRYKRHVLSTRDDQVDWAQTKEPFLHAPADAATLATVRRRLRSQEYMPRYRPFGEPKYEPGQPRDALHEIRDTILPDAPPLFTYGSAERIEVQVNRAALRVSASAAREWQNQRSVFPKGPYGTTIQPFRQDVSKAAIRRQFFDIEYSLPNIPLGNELARVALPMDNWLMFVPTTGFFKKGYLEFKRLDAGFSENFDHYAMATPHLKAGDYIDYDIIAFGDCLIPEEIPGLQIFLHNTGNTKTAHPVE